MQPNIIFYFSDQQRSDTVTEDIMPTLCDLAKEGTRFENSFTCQPVCGPARACLQSGVYATQCGCFKNGVALPQNIKTLADYFNDAGYETAAAEDGAAAFEIPVASLDQDLPVATHSASQNMWFDRAVRLDSTTLKRLD